VYPNDTAPRYVSGSYSNFKISQFLTHSKPVLVNCYDSSCWLALLHNSQGIDSQVQLFFVSPASSPASGSNTNKVCLIGGNPLNQGDYSDTFWGNHQVALISNLVYSSCAAHWLNPGGNLYRRPRKHGPYPTTGKT
jgi:hypothetical protein